MALRNTLEYSAVFGINGHQLTRTLSQSAHHELPRYYKRFFIRESHTFPVPECCERRIQAGGAHNSIQHNVGVCKCRGFFQTRWAPLPVFGSIVVARHNSDKLWPEALRLPRQHITVPIACERHDVETVRMPRYHTQRRGAHRAG
jgi:hypothetical protein